MTPSLGRRASYGPTSPVVGARGERTRQAILDAAVETFQAKGLPDTSVDDIAEAAGVSRATLYQYFESRDELFAELTQVAASDLLGLIRRPPHLAPTAEGYDSLHGWLAEWARIQDKYKTLSLQLTVIDFPQSSLRSVIARHIVDYVSSLTPWLGSAVDDGLDINGTATVLLALLFRVNEYRARGVNRGLDDTELLAAVTVFVQFVLFPSTPATAVPPRGGVPRAGRPERPGKSMPRAGSDAGSPSAAVQRILDAGAATFAVRGYHATSVQDVLAVAGAGRATFYRHFSDKADLLASLSRDGMARLIEQVDRFPAAIRDGAALRQWLAESLSLHRRYRGVFRALLQSRMDHPVLEQLRASSLEEIFQTFDDALASVERSRLLDVRVGSLVLLSLLERGPDYNFGTPYDLSPERVVDILAALMERGLLGSVHQ